MDKVIIVAFRGEPSCFQHALLNVLDMVDRGFDARLIIEGSATKNIKELHGSSERLAKLYQRVKDQSLIEAVCRACSAQMGALESAEEQGLYIDGGMSGHPSLGKYIADGYQVVVL